MKVTPAGAHAHQLTRLGLMNCYLVRESDSYTLIDTTISDAAKGIIATARALGPEPLSRILLTHAHVDHVGSVDDLARDLGKVDLAISTRDARLLQKPPDKTLEPGEPQGKIKGGLPGTSTRPTHLLSEAELFGSLRVLATRAIRPATPASSTSGTVLSTPATLSSVSAAMSTLPALGLGSFLFPPWPPGTNHSLSTAPKSSSTRLARTSAAMPPATGAFLKAVPPCFARPSNTPRKKSAKGFAKGPAPRFGFGRAIASADFCKAEPGGCLAAPVQLHWSPRQRMLPFTCQPSLLEREVPFRRLVGIIDQH